MDFFLQADTWIALLTLTFLEIVLGIDNIIFISIVAGKLPEHQQKKARLIGLSLALIVRIFLLMGITWLIGLTDPVLEISTFNLSWRDIILFVGGLFLIAKSTSEIHHKVEGDEEEISKPKKVSAFGSALVQIVLLDIIFSFDSILTAVGLTNEISLMIIAVIVSILVMMIFAGAISNFINKHPTLQVLALSFLILIGFMLVVEALHYEVPKGYIYFAVFFSLLVEIINMRVRKK
ncbi:TerC family protein [Vicingus serpentipes]|uniref:TerC family protein n=1 Tax=Vicingus serpentipes TaxID=1926625 RepID=A0A5C6RZ26_9FLAO|nr:TerC family protein [Vicingus serpentipes]TXB67317.1 TerC family protein [Vicingus serpentipes]